MANKILTNEGWEQRIRDKLGVDDAYLPDSAIQQPDIITVAEANIIDDVPDYDTLTDKTWLEAATVCECAVLLCPSMPARLPSMERGPHMQQQTDVDWDKKKAEIIANRDSFIAKIVPFTNVKHFGIIGG